VSHLSRQYAHLPVPTQRDASLALTARPEHDGSDEDDKERRRQPPNDGGIAVQKTLMPPGLFNVVLQYADRSLTVAALWRAIVVL